MNASWIQKTAQSRYTWAALGGLALAAAFPKVGLAGLAWVAPGWILFSALGRRGGEIYRIGFAGGLSYALAAFYWILMIPFPAGAIAGWLALSAYVALYTGAWVWLCWTLYPARPEDTTVQRFLGVSLGRRVLWAFSCAALWVTLEMIISRLFTGFPWNLLGVSQYKILPVIQIAEWTGVYGISFLLVWFAVALAGAVMNLLSNPTTSRAWLGDLLLPLIALLVTVGFGASELARPRPAPARTITAVLVQPSIPQTLIWDTNQSALRFTELLTLTEHALKETTNAQLLIWPEAAVPNMLRYDFDVYHAVTNLVMQHRVWMILGSDDAVARPGADESDYDVYNSSFLVTPEAEIAMAYRKRQLVIFGEYIPLERWLPFMKYLTPVGGSFAAGRQPMPFILPELGVKTSVLICFEDIFPHVGRQYVETDTDFLVNITNNGWFGESAAQWQHAANAVFRTVENRIMLVRCANNGLTCWVDAWGGMHDVYFPDSKDVYGAGFKVVTIPLAARGERHPLTFYTRHGDCFGWSCMLWSVGCVSATALSRRRKAQAENSDNQITPSL